MVAHSWAQEDSWRKLLDFLRQNLYVTTASVSDLWPWQQLVIVDAQIDDFHPGSEKNVNVNNLYNVKQNTILIPTMTPDPWPWLNTNCVTWSIKRIFEELIMNGSKNESAWCHIEIFWSCQMYWNDFFTLLCNKIHLKINPEFTLRGISFAIFWSSRPPPARRASEQDAPVGGAKSGHHCSSLCSYFLLMDVWPSQSSSLVLLMIFLFPILPILTWTCLLPQPLPEVGEEALPLLGPHQSNLKLQPTVALSFWVTRTAERLKDPYK